MIRHATFTIVTPDLEQAVPFHKDILQIPMTYSVAGRVAIFNTNGTSFTVYQDESGDEPGTARSGLPGGKVIIGFIVDEPLREIKRRIETEVRIRAEADPEGHPYKMLFIEDFDGNEICLAEPKGS